MKTEPEEGKDKEFVEKVQTEPTKFKDEEFKEDTKALEDKNEGD